MSEEKSCLTCKIGKFCSIKRDAESSQHGLSMSYCDYAAFLTNPLEIVEQNRQNLLRLTAQGCKEFAE